MAALVPVATLESAIKSHTERFLLELDNVKSSFDTNVSAKKYKEALNNISLANATTRSYHGFVSVHKAVIRYPHLNVFNHTELQGFIRDDSVSHHERLANRFVMGYLRKEAMRLPNISTGMISSSGMDIVMFTSIQNGSSEHDVVNRYVRLVNRKLAFGNLVANIQYSVAQSSRVLAITFEVAVSPAQRNALFASITNSLSGKAAAALNLDNAVELTPIAASAGQGIGIAHEGFHPSNEFMETLARVTAAFRNISRFSHERYAL